MHRRKPRGKARTARSTSAVRLAALDTAESREWLCANGIGGFASGTVAGLPPAAITGSWSRR